MKPGTDRTLAVLSIYSAMAMVLMAKQCVILKMYGLSQWPDLTTFGTLGIQPGVLLPVLGSVLTTFCKFPPAGVLMILLSLAGLTTAVRKLTGPSILSCFPAVCIFLFISGLDYSLYLMRAQGVLFSQTVGLTFSFLLIFGWNRIGKGKTWTEVTYILAAALIGYPAIGAFAIVALSGILVKSIVRKDWLGAAASALFGSVIPYLLTTTVFTHIDIRYTYLSALPYMDFVGNPARFIPLAAAMFSAVILPTIPHRTFNRGGVLFHTAFGTATVAAVILLSYRDRNFHIELLMEQAIERNDWDVVLKYASRTESPTRVIVLYRNIALAAKGQLCDKMFAYSHETIPLNTPSQISQTEVCALPVFFHNGQLNFCARWGWEMSMMFQRCIERYKYLAKVALFKGEDNPHLTEKYLEIIERNPFEKGWAARYRKYLNDRKTLAEDEEYRLVMPLDDFDENKYMSSAVVENTLLNHYVLLKNPDGLMLQQALASAMTMKDADSFRTYFDMLVKQGGRIPVHAGEAAILFAYFTRNQSVIDSVAEYLGGPQSQVVQNFVRFSGEASAIRNFETAKPEFRKKYGDTYWYYFTFVQALTTD